ncbi:hypothetical protein NIES4073_46610 [Kalymmatonema gypsitolerans NIES-4073]|nr:hypothetical protein NIES4073_46610 [Scytonema sp. NIES-4073]
MLRLYIGDHACKQSYLKRIALYSNPVYYRHCVAPSLVGKGLGLGFVEVTLCRVGNTSQSITVLEYRWAVTTTVDLVSKRFTHYPPYNIAFVLITDN